VTSNSSQNPGSQYPDSLGAESLLIALIGPDDLRRRSAFHALTECPGCDIKEFSNYPASLDEVPRLLELRNDVIIIDLDENPEFALELVESICANGSATVMVYSFKADPDMLVRCMRSSRGAKRKLQVDVDQKQ
jgi:pilus assembly protein CpaE